MSGTAVVVGATGAVGGAIARRLRSEGLSLVAVARDEALLKEQYDGDRGVRICPADIAADDAIATLRAALDGTVRIAVLAAGLPIAGSLETLDLATIPQGAQVKLGGLLRLWHAVGPHLGAGSRLVALGGHYAFEPVPHAPLAGMVNAALANLVRQLATVCGPRGLTVHLVSPGALDTPRLRRIAADGAARRGVDVEAVLDEYRAASPLGRLTTLDEVAWAVATLLAPEAAALHGSTLQLDAGRRHAIP